MSGAPGGTGGPDRIGVGGGGESDRLDGADAGSSLAADAARLLRSGPLHTLDLARRVLSLRGNPGAASAAVFALLGTDPRFRVDGEGRWSVDDADDPLGAPLHAGPYAVVDVETTGGSHRTGHRITEIAVVEVRDGMVTDEYRSLVHPERRIPSFISGLTGITDEMVANAPSFDGVADDVLERLEGRVFVAHNARFDWGFVGAQLGDACGQVPDVERLCTLRMARRLLPRLRRRNLDALTAYYGLKVEARHRAFGDALATARVLLRLLDEARRQGAHDLPGLRRLLDGGGNRRGKSRTSPCPPEDR